MSAAGIGPDTFVVAYDDQSGADRGAALVRAARARARRGGRARRRPREVARRRAAARRPTCRPYAPRAFTARLRPELLASQEELLGRRPPLVLDARAPERYRGETEPIDPRAGHIPGAVNAPFAGNLTAMPSPSSARPKSCARASPALGADAATPVVYCGSGVTACHDLLALHRAGPAGPPVPGLVERVELQPGAADRDRLAGRHS